MRICENCGSHFNDEELICPVCGQEIQLVPDYVTIEDHIKEDQLLKEEYTQNLFAEEEKRARQEEARRKRKRRTTILLTALIAIAAVLVIIVGIQINRIRNNNSFDYQYSNAVTAYNGGDMDSASSYLERALKLDPDNTDALYLLARVRLGQGSEADAESVLKKIISDGKNTSEAYEMLINMYRQREDTNAVTQLLLGCPDEKLIEKYASYLPSAPVFDVEEGSYDREFSVSITKEGKGTIYYTTDGTDPDQSSHVYGGPVAMKEGTTRLKAVTITKVGAVSAVTSAVYVIELETPPAPKITPVSGTYEEDQEVYNSDQENKYMVKVDVPTGYTCYYAWDKKPDKSSSKYTKPIALRPGEHVFYAVLEGKNGKLGKTASATYVYIVSDKKVTPSVTPTPTPKPQNLDPDSTVDPHTVVTPEPGQDPSSGENDPSIPEGDPEDPEAAKATGQAFGEQE